MGLPIGEWAWVSSGGVAIVAIATSSAHSAGDAVGMGGRQWSGDLLGGLEPRPPGRLLRHGHHASPRLAHQVAQLVRR